MTLKGIKFSVPPNRGSQRHKKYAAHLPNGQVVYFGDRRYQHYRDTVPKSRGGGKWSKLNHNSLKRRRNYRARHGGLKCKNGQRCIDVVHSPAWFSYHYLW